MSDPTHPGEHTLATPDWRLALLAGDGTGPVFAVATHPRLHGLYMLDVSGGTQLERLWVAPSDGQLRDLIADDRDVIGVHGPGYGGGGVQRFRVSTDHRSIQDIGPLYLPDEDQCSAIAATLSFGRLFVLGGEGGSTGVIRGWLLEGDVANPSGSATVPNPEVRGIGYAHMVVSSEQVCFVIDRHLRVADVSRCPTVRVPGSEIPTPQQSPRRPN